MKKIFCYELNEVPWRVVDLYLQSYPNGALAKCLNSSHQFTTHTKDTGELHPWSTWPTMHRGVSNDTHNIRFLNQDLTSAKQWPPIWDILNKENITTGIVGSLQSYPVVRNKQMLFHIPDTFAAGPETLPARYSAFQALNLKLTGNNTAVTSSIGLRDAVQATNLIRSGVKLSTFGATALHLISERINPLYKSRRATMQPELAMDVLINCLKYSQPTYVSFFTNHVAGIMHRYWKYSFPEDFNYTIQSDTDKFHSKSIIKAMKQVDQHLGRLKPILERHGYSLVICSSMGQQAIDRGEYTPELRISNFDKMLSNLSQPYKLKKNLAMHPDLAFEFESKSDLDNFRKEVASITDLDGKILFKETYKPIGLTLNLNMQKSSTVASEKALLHNGVKTKVETLGLEVFTRDIGTGYHQPNGILALPGDGKLHQSRSTIDSTNYLPTILKLLGVSPAQYMEKDVFSKLKETVTHTTSRRKLPAHA